MTLSASYPEFTKLSATDYCELSSSLQFNPHKNFDSKKCSDKDFGMGESERRKITNSILRHWTKAQITLVDICCRMSFRQHGNRMEKI